MEMSKTYDPKSFENKLYKEWVDKGYFKAKVDSKKEPFTIVIPPPNITGQLHIGHALNDTIQDVIIRFKRMQGFSTLWLPGTDHASIATEVKIVEKMKKEEGLTKQDVGREGFLKRAWAWKEQYGGRIVEQLKKLGASCDWSRETFTMDEKCSKAVNEVFVNLFNKGLIYKGDRIINWCPCCKTALSDAEVEYSEQDSHLWHIRYPLADGSGEIIVATTRPETMLGDTAVAVNPKDERYSDMVGKMLILPLVNKQIPIVADEYVEKDFGSGAVKITPAHDPNDFEVGLRHNLEVIKIMNDDGSMNEFAGAYKGLDRVEARKRICEDLQAQGYMVKIEDYKHNVGECYRCHATVEPIVSKQWFVKMQPLAKPAIDVVRKKKVEFIPSRFSKTYYNWMENIKDWCISRQLWWGHRIPAYYCDDCGQMTVSKTAVNVCPKCGSKRVRQDEDVLDTWFSSALWPFSTLGYPDNTEDLKYFYPNSLLVTAYDIIFFWVARMIFSGIEHMGEIPFPEVLIHGIVRDSQGRKMSKSLGNGIDPLEIIDSYGADSLRFSLVQGLAPGNDTRYTDQKTEFSRNFMNKLWNASRFVLLNLEGVRVKEMGAFRLTNADKWILSRLNKATKEITANLEKYELGNAAAKLYDFVWTEFCDWYIELAKVALYGDNEDKKVNTLSVLVYVLENILKLMHPFVPFITEEIYKNLPTAKKSIVISSWPTVNKKYNYAKESGEFAKAMEAVKAIRNMKAEKGVAPSKKIKAYFIASSINPKDVSYIYKLAGVETAEFLQDKSSIAEKIVSLFGDFGEIAVPLGDLVDVKKEIERLSGELAYMQKEVERSQKMLSNQGFVAKAPKALIDKEKEKLANNQEKARKLQLEIENLKN
ncbi:MAG: valine--tRNA ligase, partial [Clostridia bacterium]|nr:valine--tRNA ligase [Clostridia bacterium]